jgi:hypothetical protein
MLVGPNKYSMEDKVEINDGHYLELMDRLHVIMSTLNDHCVEHPLTERDGELKFQLEYALGRLWDTYQYVGNMEQTKK